MTKPLRTFFVIADGGHARFVARDPETGDFHTVRELRAGGKAAHAYSGGTVEGATGHRHGTREPHEPARQAAEAFAGEIAAALKDGAERLVVVAPARMLGALRDKLPGGARERLAGELAKDLTKVPDHDLGAWLRPLEL